MNCDKCELHCKQEPLKNGVSYEDDDNEKYYSLTIKAGTLARLIQRQNLNISDLHCMSSDTKAFIQHVLLQCILCKTVQNQNNEKGILPLSGRRNIP